MIQAQLTQILRVALSIIHLREMRSFVGEVRNFPYKIVETPLVRGGKLLKTPKIITKELGDGFYLFLNLKLLGNRIQSCFKRF